MSGWLGYAHAQAVPPLAQAQATQSDQEQRQRAQREAEQRASQVQAPDVRLPAPRTSDYRQTQLPQEAPCFRVATLRLEGAHAAEFAFVQDYLQAYAGRCLGQQGLQQLTQRATDLMLSRGYVTSRLLLPEQSLASGTLRLMLVPGLVGAVRFAPGSARTHWSNALPLRAGQVLNLRAIEQGLEQLKRVPSQDVKIDIAPGATPATSDLVLSVTRSKPWRVTFHRDDGGGDATGKEQGGVDLAIDQPLGLNDLLSVGVTHQVGHYRGTKGTQGTHFDYSVPWGAWTLHLSSYRNGYHQWIAGSQQTFRYCGDSLTRVASASRLLHRDAVSQTSLQWSISARQAHSRIDGVAISTQHRQTRAAELALVHRRYLGAAQLDVRAAYRRGVPWFGGQWSASAPRGPTFRYGLATVDASVNLPFRRFGQAWLWTSELHAQASGDSLYLEDNLSIGGRYSVRGFDGNQTLGGAHGAYWRNTLAWPLGGSGASLYGGVDVGRVGGEARRAQPSHTLSGRVLGLRGGRWNLNWDLFAGWAMHAPQGFHTRRPTAGMQWIYSF